MSQSSPLSRVKEKFGGKDKLVDQIVGLLGSTGDEPKDELRKRLLGAANRKLIRLHEVASGLKQHGGHDKLADAAAAGLGRAKDKDYVQKLTTYSAIIFMLTSIGLTILLSRASANDSVLSGHPTQQSTPVK